jgi:hypothetical protein
MGSHDKDTAALQKKKVRGFPVQFTLPSRKQTEKYIDFLPSYKEHGAFTLGQNTRLDPIQGREPEFYEDAEGIKAFAVDPDVIAQPQPTGMSEAEVQKELDRLLADYQYSAEGHIINPRDREKLVKERGFSIENTDRSLLQEMGHFLTGSEIGSGLLKVAKASSTAGRIAAAHIPGVSEAFAVPADVGKVALEQLNALRGLNNPYAPRLAATLERLMAGEEVKLTDVEKSQMADAQVRAHTKDWIRGEIDFSQLNSRVQEVEYPFFADLTREVLFDVTNVAGPIAGGLKAIPAVGKLTERFAGVLKVLESVPKPPDAPIPPNIVGLTEIAPGLTPYDRMQNTVMDTLGLQRFTKTPNKDELVEGAMDVMQKGYEASASQGANLGAKNHFRLNQVFDFNKQGGLDDLKNIDPSLPRDVAPTIQDVAASLPLYREHLSEGQLNALLALQDDIKQYQNLFDNLGIEFRQRLDIMDGGFYIPRGRALKEDEDLPYLFNGRSISWQKKSKADALKAARFDSMAHGISEGYGYGDIGEVLTHFFHQMGTQSTDKHFADWFLTLADENGQLIGMTAKDRMLLQNPEIKIKMDMIRKEIDRLRALGGNMENRTELAVAQFLNDPEFYDIDELIAALSINVKSGKNKGADLAEINARLAEAKKIAKGLKPKYEHALRLARQGTTSITDPGGHLTGKLWPDELASAANKALVEITDRNKLSDAVSTFNNLYRGMRATMDLSAIGIQSMLAIGESPSSAITAIKVGVTGVWDSQILGKYLVQFDELAEASGRLTSTQWISYGLHLGGQETEFMLGRSGITEALQRVPGIQQANRSFGFLGDSLRMDWADDMLANERAGRTMEEIAASGDLQRIAEITNNMTGWSAGKTFGNTGDLLLFAPRFFQSRLTTISRAAMSLRPGATLDQRMARRSILKMVGWGSVFTVAVNEALGNETDFRPIVDGRWNSNFMRIRFKGRDYSVFGPWDSMARILVNMGGSATDALSGSGREAVGEGADVLRGVGSGFVSNVFDFVSGSNFRGERTRDTNAQIAWRLFQNFLPFSGEEALGGDLFRGGIAGGFAGFVGEIIGIKSSPVTPWEQLQELRRQSKMSDEMPALFAVRDYEGMDFTERVMVDTNPEFAADIEAAKALVAQSRRDRASEYQKYRDEITKFNDLYTTQLDSLGTVPADEAEIRAQFSATRQRTGLEWDGEEARDKIDRFQRDRAVKMALTREFFEDTLNAFSDVEPQAYLDKALADYLDAVYNKEAPLEDPVTGEYDYEERDRRVSYLRRADIYGSKVIDAVEDFLRSNDHPIEKKLREDRELLRPYWDITPTAMENAGLTEEWETYVALPSNTKQVVMSAFRDVAANGEEQARLFLDTYDKAALAKEEVRTARDAEGNFVWPEIREALLRWGYKNWSADDVANGDFLEISSAGVE